MNIESAVCFKPGVSNELDNATYETTTVIQKLE
ncbi:hypothetical protein T06_2531 [Trichinella sp. T6]|nr:hypothetical protein T06_2531 [Trichinella sp. T6]